MAKVVITIKDKGVAGITLDTKGLDFADRGVAPSLAEVMAFVGLQAISGLTEILPFAIPTFEAIAEASDDDDGEPADDNEDGE